MLGIMQFRRSGLISMKIINGNMKNRTANNNINIFRDAHTPKSVIRDGGYHCTSNHLSEDRNLSLLEVGIMEYILHKPDNWRIIKCEIEKRANVSSQKFDKIWKHLIELGYISYSGNTRSRIWNAHETPIWIKNDLNHLDQK